MVLLRHTLGSLLGCRAAGWDARTGAYWFGRKKNRPAKHEPAIGVPQVRNTMNVGAHKRGKQKTALVFAEEDRAPQAGVARPAERKTLRAGRLP